MAEAIKSYQTALSHNPKHADAWFNLGVARARLGDKEKDQVRKQALLIKERDAYKKVVEIKPSYHKGWYNLAIAYNKLGEMDNEIMAYEKALEGREQYPQALYNLAYAYEEKGQNDKAIATWTRYVEIAAKPPTEQQYVQEAKSELERLIRSRSEK